jgi:hypothetical protein
MYFKYKSHKEFVPTIDNNLHIIENDGTPTYNPYTGVPQYARVIRSKTYHSYMKPRIVPNAIYNDIYVTYINTVKFNR